MKKIGRTTKILGKFAIHSFEESAFILDTFKFPIKKIDKLRIKSIHELHFKSNELRKLLGEKPKKHRRVIGYQLMEEY